MEHDAREWVGVVMEEVGLHRICLNSFVSLTSWISTDKLLTILVSVIFKSHHHAISTLRCFSGGAPVLQTKACC